MRIGWTRHPEMLLKLAPEGAGGSVTSSGSASDPPLVPGGSAAKPPEPDQAAKAKADADAKAAAEKAAAEKAAADQAAKDAAAMGASITGGGKNLTIPQSKMKEIKQAEQRKALEALARDLGYSSVEEMRAKARAGSTPRPPDGTPKPPDGARPPDEQHRNNRREAQLQRERDELQAKAAREARAARKAQERIDAMQVEMALREKLTASGVKKVKLALHMIEDHIDSMSDEQLATYNEDALIDGWRKTDPYLFDTITQPANTGPGAGAPPPPATKGNGAGAGNDKVNCMDMTPAQFEQYKRAKGLVGADFVPDLRSMQGK